MTKNCFNLAGQGWIQNAIISKLRTDIPGPGIGVFGQNGIIVYVGSQENFIFTLEDCSTVTKSTRVISTTTTPAT